MTFAASWPPTRETLAACLRFDTAFERAAERLGTYAFLKTAEDAANSACRRMIGRYRNVASLAAQAASYIRPEVMAIPTKTITTFLAAKQLAGVSLAARATLRYKPHTLFEARRKVAGHAE